MEFRRFVLSKKRICWRIVEEVLSELIKIKRNERSFVHGRRWGRKCAIKDAQKLNSLLESKGSGITGFSPEPFLAGF